VNPYLAVAALVCMASLMFMLPLIPAWVELRRKSDARPLSVVQQHAGEIRHFANSFRDYIEGLQPIMQRCVDAGTSATGTLRDGEEYIVLGRADEPLVLALQQRDATRPVVMLAGVDLIVPPDATFSRDIYARGQFIGGDKNNYRAILGEKNVHLGTSSRVMRWVHAVGEFTADLGCRLFGRISSDSLIRLHTHCSFLRLNAPRIEIGHAAVEANETTLNSSIRPDAVSAAAQRFLLDGDFEVRAGQVINGNVVIRGRLLIRSGAWVRGSVKSGKDMVLEGGVSVEGSLISATKMRIGPGCAIHGPVIAERELAIATGVRCGAVEHPTTVSAPRIDVEEGVVVFGTLWARERGQVVANP
jgi:cytoskeletal protein CcmA (bactofilin family)